MLVIQLYIRVQPAINHKIQIIKLLYDKYFASIELKKMGTI